MVQLGQGGVREKQVRARIMEASMVANDVCNVQIYGMQYARLGSFWRLNTLLTITE